jgi:Major Facilitator Superfamily
MALRLESIRMSSSARANSLTVLLGIGAATAAAHMGNNFTTYLIGGLMDRYGFRPLQMGLWSLAEMLSYAVAMFLIAPRAPRRSPRQLMVLAGVLVASAQLASAGLADFVPLLAGRILTGLGFGLANTALNLAAGRTPSPARAISAGIALQTLGYALINIYLPIVGKHFGVGGMFASLAALTALFTLAAGWLPAGSSAAADAASGVAGALAARRPLGSDGWRMLIAMAFFTFGSLAIWPFIERAAHAIDIPAEQFGRYQSAATLVSALSSLGLAAIAARLSVRRPLMVVVLTCGVSCAALTTVSAAPPFALALILFNASWFASYSLLLGISYSVDESGRLAVLCSGVWLLMMSLGSLATGATAQWAGSYRIVGPAGLGFCVAAIGIVSPLASRVERAR